MDDRELLTRIAANDHSISPDLDAVVSMLARRVLALEGQARQPGLFDPLAAVEAIPDPELREKARKLIGL
jgi:hypothetical protein